MTGVQNTAPRNLRRGGEPIRFATLFWFLIVFCIGWMIDWTVGEQAKQDTLIGYIPADVRLYTHYSAHLNKEPLGMNIFDVPYGLTPDEVASAQLANESWVTLVAWHKVPSPEEVQIILDTDNAHQLAESTFVLGDTTSLISTTASLKDTRVANGLSLLSSLHALQGYVQTPPSFEGEEESIVYGVSFRSDNLVAKAIPLSNIPAEKQLMGLSSAQSYTRKTPVFLNDTNAESRIVMNDGVSSAPLPLIFPGLVDVMEAAGTPTHTLLAPAEKRVTNLLRTPSALHIYSDGEDADFMLHLPQVNGEALRKAIGGLLSVALPSNGLFLLPDGDEVQEILISDEKFMFFVAGNGSHVLGENIADLTLTVSEDGRGGSILASSPDTLKTHPSTPYTQISPLIHCFTHSIHRSLWTTNPALFLSEASLIPHHVLSKFPVILLDVHNFVDNTANLCGYYGHNVDNL